MKLCFVSVNGPMEPYLPDEPRIIRRLKTSSPLFHFQIGKQSEIEIKIGPFSTFTGSSRHVYVQLLLIFCEVSGGKLRCNATNAQNFS
jgi:hypothetical protein